MSPIRTKEVYKNSIYCPYCNAKDYETSINLSTNSFFCRYCKKEIFQELYNSGEIINVWIPDTILIKNKKQSNEKKVVPKFTLAQRIYNFYVYIFYIIESIRKK